MSVFQSGAGCAARGAVEAANDGFVPRGTKYKRNNFCSPTVWAMLRASIISPSVVTEVELPNGEKTSDFVMAKPRVRRSKHKTLLLELTQEALMNQEKRSRIHECLNERQKTDNKLRRRVRHEFVTL